MLKRTYRVEAVWDDEAKVYYAKSEIDGLAIEAPTLDEFEEIMLELAPELIVVNHVLQRGLANQPMKDLVPTLLWQRPPEDLAVA